VEQERRPDADEREASRAEPWSFEAVFVANFPHVHRFLARRVGTALADDLAAETFAVAFRRRQSYDPGLGSVRVGVIT
jgi:RNA polymerase sigma-70 factor (ECF subfamily)